MKMKLTNEIIRQPTKPFDFETENAQEIFDALKNELISHKNGLGLSANQIGLNTSVIVFGVSEMPETIEALFNPNIVHMSLEKNELEESCLSYPDISGKVSRSFMIRVRFQTLTGATKTATFNGMTARIIQHECDHLNGVIFTDYLSDFQLRRAIEKANKTGKKKYIMKDLRQNAKSES